MTGQLPDVQDDGGNWWVRAACRGLASPKHDPWFDERNLSRAGVTCRTSCWVRSQCLEDALAREGTAGRSSRHGMWGGMTPYQRRREYERRCAASSGDPPGSRVA